MLRNILLAAGGAVVLCIGLYFLVIRREVILLSPLEVGSGEVNYVGDEECYDCHSNIYNSFKKNGMGRSFYLPTVENMIEDYEKNNVVYDPKSNYYYKMFSDGDEFYQMEYRTDGTGKRTHELTRKVDYIIGSGNHTRSYITNENGFLYEMPVTWYVEKKKWSLSPGYQKRNMRFSRAISQECLNCHNSYPEHVEFTENKFNRVPHGIGCERCHGPGQAHIKRWSEENISHALQKGGMKDSTIVNPKRLDFPHQLDVCFQCHLQGDVHVFKDGKKQTDFRPGLRLGDIKAVFFHDNVSEGDFRIASHGARMIMSECFKKSGKMSCTTCHDPHISVKSVKRETFNDQCKACHSVESLSHTSKDVISVTPFKGGKSGVDHRETADCISCHMRQGGTSDIPHVNFTDHWIRKEIKVLTKNQIDSAVSVSEVVTLKEYRHAGTPSQNSSTEINRGIAYVKYYEEKHNHPDYLNRAIPMLERGLYYFPENKEAMYYLGTAYVHLRKYSEAERTFRKLTGTDSRNGPAYYQLGLVLESQNRLNEAIEQFLKAVEIVPDNYKVYNSLGNTYVQIGNREKAIESYQRAINIMPMYAIVFNNLGDLYFHQLSDTAKARKYIEMALHLDPDFTMAILNLANLTLMGGNDNKAEKLLKEIIKIDDKFVSAYGNLAVIYKNRGKKDEAVKYLNKVLELSPGDRNARRMLEEMK